MEIIHCNATSLQTKLKKQRKCWPSFLFVFLQQERKLRNDDCGIENIGK